MDPIGAAFGKYGLPLDDLLARLSPTITTSGSPGVEDPAYPITNWQVVKPAKPAKFLTAFEVQIDFDFLGPANVAAFALIYHNIAAGTNVTLEWDSDPAFSPAVGSQSITIPEWHENGDSVSPWAEIPNSPTYQYWRLTIGGGSPANSQAFSIGRPVFLGALRDLENDVRWGVVEEGGYQNIVHPTLLQVETVYEIGGERRSFQGEFALRNDEPYPHAQQLISLFRSAHMNSKPWILIPDVLVNEAWIVRFVDSAWSRTRETLNHNIFPFRVMELSRGLPWP